MDGCVYLDASFLFKMIWSKLYCKAIFDIVALELLSTNYFIYIIIIENHHDGRKRKDSFTKVTDQLFT